MMATVPVLTLQIDVHTPGVMESMTRGDYITIGVIVLGLVILTLLGKRIRA